MPPCTIPRNAEPAISTDFLNGAGIVLRMVFDSHIVVSAVFKPLKQRTYLSTGFSSARPVPDVSTKSAETKLC